MAKPKRMQKIIAFKSSEVDLYEIAQNKKNFSKWVKSKLAEEVVNNTTTCQVVESETKPQKPETIVWSIPKGVF